MRALAEELATFTTGASLEERSSAYEAVRVRRLQDEYRLADSLYRQARLNLEAAQRMYAVTPLTTEGMQQLMGGHEALVIFDLREVSLHGQERHASVAYLVLSDSLVVRPVKVDTQSLEESVRFFRDLLRSPSLQEAALWEAASRKLYRTLLQPLLAGLPKTVRHLHIVPEGVLHYLPFAALQNDRGRFLVEDYTLSVVPSASILQLARAQNPGRWRSMLLAGDPDGSLPGARAEVRTVASAVSPEQSLVLVGQEVTQEVLERNAQRFDILHIATHGYFESRTPWNSHLQLHEDVLSVDEIGRLRLQTYLVTLSGCETALGSGLVTDVPDGDEWVGLQQAFLAAGTPTVMATLWPIHDEVSSRFMGSFYSLLVNQSKARALADVQRRFIRDEQLGHPFYWAPFVIVGDPR